MELLGLFNLSPETVQAWFEYGGYFMLFGLLFVAGLGFPMPEDIPLLLGGFFVAHGKMQLLPVAVLAWCGIIGGDCILYYLAHRYGMGVTRLPLIGRHVTEKRIRKAEKLFEEYGGWIVAIGRLFAGIRGAMVIAAGTIRYNFVKFVIVDGLAALISGGLWIWLGWWLGLKFKDKSIAQIRQDIKPYEHWVVLGIVVFAVLLIGYFVWRHRQHKTLAEAAIDKAEEIVEQKHQA